MQRPLIIIVFTRMICGHPFLLVIRFYFFFASSKDLSYLAFNWEMTFFPVLASISLRVFPAIVPPCRAIILFSVIVFGFFSFDISVVVASASN